ncbi:uncharacterized protein KY384_002658 [Bacidia gigantensis]|uniref:uncharacterized protein n=1 Tax=Bacidia gigantensis TaxID=2732470 RepID=UPI001D04E410|nr:uncharacterized protein KY384_002658 [Bacidia gigantensis]KAG8532780.1 hypothetical protein KY384_002658 [Bacidia gigantensis]
MATDPQKYILNHTALRVKDPERSIKYYEFLGMKQLAKLEDPAKQGFDCYFLGFDSPQSLSYGKQQTDRQGILELQYYYGAKEDDDYKINNGNSDPGKGFGHVCISCDHLQAACQRIEDAGYKFQKKLTDGRMKSIAFALDPDGYWVELIGINAVEKTENEKQTDTSTYRFNHTMSLLLALTIRTTSLLASNADIETKMKIRVKDPETSLKFYQEVFGMKLHRTIENSATSFNLYFLAYEDRISGLEKAPAGANPLAGQEGILELTWNYGTEKDEDFTYHSGNEDPKGYGHIGIMVDNLGAACERLEQKGVIWQKRLSDGNINFLAFCKDPDGYWIETSSRPYYGRHQPVSKRGHVPQISISDDNHHVTEAIGDMYGDHDYSKREARPLSFVSTSTAPANTSPLSPQRQTSNSNSPPPRSSSQRQALGRTVSGDRIHPAINGQNNMNMANKATAGDVEGSSGQLSPRPSLRRQPSTSETASSHFPLNDIDYESSPNAIAQELNNLSALRRMSMDVNASRDPDLPSFNSNFGIPSAPPDSTDPDDTARLYWVPASVHPELAPMEFKTFLDKKVKSLRRRSEEKQGALAADGVERDTSSASLRRRRSMLSKQIDNTNGRGAEGYQDGAERLEKRRSQSSGELLSGGITNLQDLERLVNEPETIIQRLSLEAGSESASGEVLPGDDMPILPQIPPSNNSLKRSTRTTYRRGGSLRRGERAPFSKRAAQLAGGGEIDGDQSPSSSPQLPSDEAFNLSRVQTEPAPGTTPAAENFSRPNRMNRRAQMPLRDHPGQPSEERPARRGSESHDQRPSDLQHSSRQSPQPRHFVSQIASNGRIGVPLGKQSPVPSIVETPPPSDAQNYQPPQRSSSHVPPQSMPPSAPPSAPPSTHRPHDRSAQSRTNQSIKPGQSLNDMTQHPSPLPGNNTRTDSLSFIPTLTEDKKADGKKLKDKKEKDSEGGRKSSWSWGALLGNEEKEKEKKKEDETKKAKSRLGKQSDKSYDNTRLDVLQTTMDSNRGRESLVLDRGDLKLEEERKKESSRKSSGGDAKKEKETGFFSSLLGGGKKKADRDSAGKKYYSRNLSPEPPARILTPDIDYNWTRFSILEERAIYRMAHIKLANPRRALHSQVLLSNFMYEENVVNMGLSLRKSRYSYLAKVQQMHPQANIPQSVVQRQQAAQQKKDQPEEFLQYQKYQEQQQRKEDQEQQRAPEQQAHASQAKNSQQDNFMDMDYEYDEPEQDHGHRPQSRASQHSARSFDNNNHGNHQRRNQRHGQQHGQQHDYQQTSPYAYQQSQFDEPDRSDDDMW